jgi:hypothetical protein
MIRAPVKQGQKRFYWAGRGAEVGKDRRLEVEKVRR